MVRFLSSQRLFIALLSCNIILIGGLIIFNMRETSLQQKLNLLVSQQGKLREDIMLWKKFGGQLTLTVPKSQESLSTELGMVIKLYAINSAIFTETKEGFNLKLGAATDWDIYVATHALQTHLQGRYILSGLQIMRSAEGILATFQWSRL